MDTEKHSEIKVAFIISHCGYYLLLRMNNDRYMNKNINRIQGKVPQIIHQDQHQILIPLCIRTTKYPLMYRICNCPTFMTDLIPTAGQQYSLRNARSL